MKKTEIIEKIIEITKHLPVIKFFGKDSAYCEKIGLIYIFDTGWMIHKIDQRFATLAGIEHNTPANKIIVKKGLKTPENEINASELELLEILDELKNYFCEKHNLN